MATLTFAHREITAKIVYFGAPGAGSNSNVRTLYSLVSVKEKSRLHQFGPTNASEQSCYFDYVPTQGGEVPGFSTRFRVYSLPGGLRNEVHRHEVFDDTDGIVFVADARASRAKGNAQALEEMTSLLRGQGLDLANMPIVVEINHTDAPDARPPEEIMWLLNSENYPVVSAVARTGQGVIETHDHLTKELSARLRANLQGKFDAIRLNGSKRDVVERDEQVVARHLAALEAAEHTPRANLDTAISDFQLALTRRYLSLTPGPKHEVNSLPREFLGYKPVHLLDSRLDGDQIHVDVVMERVSGQGPRRLTLVLVNRPVEAPARSTPVGPVPPITGDLPDRIVPVPPPPRDLPPYWYGVAGGVFGILSGVLLAKLLFG